MDATLKEAKAVTKKVFLFSRKDKEVYPEKYVTAQSLEEAIAVMEFICNKKWADLIIQGYFYNLAFSIKKVGNHFVKII